MSRSQSLAFLSFPLLFFLFGCGSGSGENAANVPSGNIEPQPPVQQPLSQPDDPPDNTPEPVQQPVNTPDNQPVDNQPVDNPPPDNPPDNPPANPPARRSGKLDVTGQDWTSGLGFNDGESITLDMEGGEFITWEYTRFSCLGSAKCHIQVWRVGDRFYRTSRGNVIPKLDIDRYTRYMADVAYDAIEFDDDEKVEHDGFSWSYTANTVAIEEDPTARTIPRKTLSFSKNIETRHGWAGKKYELTDGGKTYEAYLYVDNTVPLFSYYGYWAIKDSTGDLKKTRGFHGFGGQRSLPNLSNLSGSATYIGDAVGNFSIKGSSPDSGSFTATATLEANFDTDKIKGTINNFNVPSLSSSSIELKETDFGDDIRRSTPSAETIWTIDGVKGDSGGDWEANIFRTHSSGVPKDVVGAFYSEHSGANAVITGGFGAEKE